MSQVIVAKNEVDRKNANDQEHASASVKTTKKKKKKRFSLKKFARAVVSFLGRRPSRENKDIKQESSTAKKSSRGDRKQSAADLNDTKKKNKKNICRRGSAPAVAAMMPKKKQHGTNNKSYTKFRSSTLLEEISPDIKRTLRKKRKFHTVRLDGTDYEIDDRYELKTTLGNGAYGVVASAIDTQTGRKVAVKRIHSLLDDEIDAKRILREIKILRHLHKHSVIVKIVDFFLEPRKDFNVVYIVLELMQTDLRRIVQSTNKLQEIHYQYITYQLLCGLKYMHSANIWHRDLKPANVLLNANSTLKICDFGLSRGVSESIDEKQVVSDYVVTRWYRAPEVMLCDSYDEKIDVWSVGCILAELHGRKPAFRGRDSRDQVSEYLKILGAPSKEDIKFISNEHARKFVENFSRDLQPENLLREKYRDVSKNAMDLMIKMLEFNPNKRISVDDALDHPFFAKIRKRRVEVTCKEKFDFSFEKNLNSKADLKREFIAEAEHWNTDWISSIESF